MIIQPYEQKFGIKAGRYPIITIPDDFIKYSKDKKGKDKKEDYVVELTGPIIPLADLLTGARVFEVDPKKKQFRPIGEGKTRLKKIKDFKEKKEAEKEEKEELEKDKEEKQLKEKVLG